MCYVQNSLEEQASQDSFVPHGRHDVLTVAIGRPEHPGCVHAAGAGAPSSNTLALLHKALVVPPPSLPKNSSNSLNKSGTSSRSQSHKK